MRATVSAAWPAMCTRFEGRCDFMYLDTKKLVTTGLGNLIDAGGSQPPESAYLPWLDKSNVPASRSAIATEWRRVKGRTDLAPKGGFAFRSSAQLHITDVTIDSLLMAKTAQFWARLQQTLPALDSFPADAQLVLLDLSWQNGPAFLDAKSGGKYVWPNMRAAALAQDWTKAAGAVPGTGARAEARKRLFRNAAKVKAAGLDPEVLWDTKTPTGPVVTPPPVTPPPVITPAPQEPTVKHSKTYDCDYVWYGKGNGYDSGWVPVNVAKILDAVAQELGRPIYLSQGGLSAYVLSGNTHKGLGAFDIGLRGLTKAHTWKLASALLRSGIVMFPRGFVWDSFQGKTIENVHDGNEHGHCCSWENMDNLHADARAQVKEYLAGGDGLRGSAKYTGPATKLEHWKTSPYNPANIKPVPDGKQAFYVDVTTTLIGNTVDRVKKQERGRGELIYAVKLVDRWGRWNAVTESGTYYALDYLSPTPLDVVDGDGVKSSD